MYESFYNLKEKPFTLLPDPGFLFMSDQHRMALTLLEYGLTNQAGFTVISGEIGAGKTTLIRHLLNNIDQEFTVGLITNTHRAFGDLLEWILLAFNIEHKGMNKVEMYQRFMDFIIDEYAHNRRTVLIVDEAQNMDADTLEELRMFSNINADKNQALQVVLSGQRELRDTLRSPALVQFAQRIAVDYHLEPLTAEEVAGYIRHRMTVAGGDPDTFTPKACIAIHRYTNGIPRLINQLCDTALVYGFADQKRRIGAQLITDVAREKQQGGIFPLTVPAEMRPEDEEIIIEPPPPVSTTASKSGVTGNSGQQHSTAGAAEQPAVRSNRPAERSKPSAAPPASIHEVAATSERKPDVMTEEEQRWLESQAGNRATGTNTRVRSGIRSRLASAARKFWF